MKPKTRHVTPDAPNAYGLASGTILLTLDGELPVEFLTIGDRVITRDTGMAVVKSVRPVRVICRAVRLAAGSLGHTRPDRDVILPADQQVLIRDWRAHALFGVQQAMVAAQQLIDGEYITDLGETRMTLYRIEFDAPHVIYADGLEVRSTQPENAQQIPHATAVTDMAGTAARAG